jgi:hypothetical protein
MTTSSALRLRPRARTTRGRRIGIVAALLFSITFVLFALTCAGPDKQLNLDAWSANYESWTIATTGQPWVDGDKVPPLDHNPIRAQWINVMPNGHTVITRVPGVVAAAIPAYLIMRPDHMTTLPGGLTAALLAAVAVALLFLALKEKLPLRVAALCALAFGVGTPVWSVAADGVWPHTVAVFGICGMAWACATGRWWWAGIFGGITIWGRVHGAVVVAIVGLYVGWRRRSWAIVARTGIASLAFLGLLCAWTSWMYVTWNPTGSYDMSGYTSHAETQPFDLVNQLGFWVSPDRGILVWTPVILLLVPALVRSWRVLPDWSRSLAVSGVVYIVVQGALNRFSGGDLFYGYRYGLETLACLTPALALSSPRIGKVAGRLLGPVLAVQTYAIAVGAVTNSHFLLDSERWHANAFVAATNESGAGAWVIVAVVAVLGWVGQQGWRRRWSTPIDDVQPYGQAVTAARS